MKANITILFSVLIWFSPAALAQMDEERPSFVLQDDHGAPVLWVFGDCDQPPSAVFEPSPAYPFTLKEQRIEGTALLRFRVDVSGSVQNLRIVRASVTEFGLAAYQAHYKAKYRPAKKNGILVECEVERLFRFKLDQ